MDKPLNGEDVFRHPLNIQIGKGRVLWGESVTFPTVRGDTHEAGWVLPGGIRTQDRELAELVARNIDRLSH